MRKPSTGAQRADGDRLARAGERPPHAPPRIQRRQLVAAPGHDEAPVRRPRRAVVGPEPPLAAVGRDHPRAVARPRRAAGRRPAAARAPAGRRLPGAEDARAPSARRRCAARRPPPRPPRPPTDSATAATRAGHGPAPAPRRVAGVRRADHAPRPLARGGVLGRGGPQRVAQLAPGHRGTAPMRSPSASRPRRRRELTVPRGRSSARAISPGVSSSR